MRQTELSQCLGDKVTQPIRDPEGGIKPTVAVGSVSDRSGQPLYRGRDGRLPLRSTQRDARCGEQPPHPNGGALPGVEEVEERLQPPALRDLGRSMANLVLRAILLGAAGALVGILRGSFGSGDPRQPDPSMEKEGPSNDGKSPDG